MEDAVFTAALADRMAGRRTYLLAATNDQAARLAARMRTELVRIGRVDDAVVVELADGNAAGVGDRIVTRRNDRYQQAGGGFVANRDVWEVTGVSADGLAVVRVDDGTGEVISGEQVVLKPGYVATDVVFEYATTVYAAQGGTRDVSHVIVSPATTRSALYVGPHPRVGGGPSLRRVPPPGGCRRRWPG